MRNKIKGIREAFFAETLLVVLPPSIIGFLSAGSSSILGILLMLIIVACWDLGINVINHYSDWHLDEINDKRSNLHKYLLKEELLILYAIFLACSFLIAFFLLKPAPYFYIVLLVEVVFGILYSMYAKVKEKFVLNYVWIAVMYGFLSFLMGFFGANSHTTNLVVYLPVIAFITLLYFSISIVKDYSDMKGDAEEHRKTIPLVLGVKKALNFQYAMITIAYIILILFVVLGYLNILLLTTLFFYVTIILILSMISRTKDTKYMRKISFYTKVNTLALDLLIIIILVLPHIL